MLKKQLVEYIIQPTNWNDQNIRDDGEDVNIKDQWNIKDNNDENKILFSNVSHRYMILPDVLIFEVALIHQNLQMWWYLKFPGSPAADNRKIILMIYTEAATSLVV